MLDVFFRRNYIGPKWIKIALKFFFTDLDRNRLEPNFASVLLPISDHKHCREFLGHKDLFAIRDFLSSDIAYSIQASTASLWSLQHAHLVCNALKRKDRFLKGSVASPDELLWVLLLQKVLRRQLFVVPRWEVLEPFLTGSLSSRTRFHQLSPSPSWQLFEFVFGQFEKPQFHSLS